MSKKARKIFEKMKQSPSGWHSHDFHTLYSGFGFRIINAKNHTVFRHPDFPRIEAMIPRHPTKVLKNVYATKAIEVIESLLELMPTETNKEEEVDDN